MAGTNMFSQLRTRFGTFTPLLLVYTTLGMLAATSTLIYIWQPSRNDAPTSPRSRLALSGWTVPLIAICSAIIRTSVSCQLGVGCAMAASLAFEHGWILFQDAATMSIQRWAGAGPYRMFFPFMRGMQLAQKYLGLYLVVQLVVVDLLINITSTILVRDTGVVFISDVPQKIAVKYDALRFGIPKEDYPFKAMPFAYPMFAEEAFGGRWETPAVDSRGMGGVADYGPLWRAYLPLPVEQRQQVLSYKGLARLVDSHVMCFSPRIKELAVGMASPDEHDDRAQVYANISSEGLQRVSKELNAGGRKSFQITKGAELDINCALRPDGEYNLCPAYVRGAAPPTDKPPQDTGSLEFPSTDPLDSWNTWWLVTKATIPTEPPAPLMGTWHENSTFTSDLNGTEWTTGKLHNSHTNATMTFYTSLCVSSFRHVEASVVVSSRSNLTEPRVPVIPGLVPTYNTTAVQNQLSGRTSVFRSRGIFPLAAHKVLSKASPGPAQQHWAVLRTANASTLLMRGASALETNVHPAYGNLFTDSMTAQRGLGETCDKPGRALQNIFSVLSANAYYAQLDSFDGLSTARVQFARAVVIPRAFTGLCIVNAVILFHLVSLCLMIWLFFRHPTEGTVPKFLDQAWHCIAQLGVGNPGGFLKHASGLADRQVAELGGAKENWNSLVKLDVDSYAYQGVVAIVPDTASRPPSDDGGRAEGDKIAMGHA
ncbi:hypothetical protein EDC01DRAFT_234317 [Geopyxis carbonaria]|nr:hypothetical protein EDC01DRAFT_234317 [Geopyxis carbonaria]